MSTKSLTERICHAIGYEATALLISIPGAAILLNRPLGHIGITVIAIALLAMAWNMVFNYYFDRVYPPRAPRNFFIRSLQAIGFEGGLLSVALPLTAWFMDMSLKEAFMMDIGLLIFYLPYTYLYNWVWDTLVNRRLKRKAA
ncbi:PACE efflux transporter [Rosenbergiella collisarenosi]|uniref:PACE efflux transporter n=1 Tax=Rosenbergiella collisarenosi TaxID=1544695 RepID=UPI001F4F2E25|nr:PACE efflux transporter [Rosenbergiella collisarenosi]